MQAAAAGSSIASLGLGAASKIMGGEADKAAAEMKAARAERAAEIGRINADLTDAGMRERLNTVISNIDAIRASGNVDPSSPSTGAIEDWQRQLSNRQRLAALGTIKEQVAEDEAGARYLHAMGDFALTKSFIGAAADVAGGVSKGISSGTFGK
jgi:hypothetical protein